MWLYEGLTKGTKLAGVQPPIWRAVLSESPLREGVREKLRQFWNSPCATKCLSIGRDSRVFAVRIALEIAIRTSNIGSRFKGRDKECHSFSFLSHFAKSTKTNLVSPDLECLQYHINDLYKYEFWMLGPDKAVRKMLGSR